MEKIKIYLIIIMCTMFISIISGQNQMPMILHIEGIQWYDHFGEKLAALDFNGDSYKDLAVVESWWVPDSLDAQLGSEWVGRNWGRILFYYGGPNFDGIPDFIIEGKRPYQFCTAGHEENFKNLGDINGDGCEDLGVFERSPDQLAIYFGSDSPSDQPGYLCEPLDNEHPFYFLFFPSDDLNGDGFADFAYFVYTTYSSHGPGSLRVVLGGNTLEEIVIANTNSGLHDVRFLYGIGDINNDGYDDYMICGYHNVINEQPPDTWAYLGYGAAQLDFNNVTLFFESVGFPMPSHVRRPLGDVNGDGYDDFIGLIDNPIKVWYGGETLTTDYNLILTPLFMGLTNFDDCIIYGDLNGDGYSDVIGADPGYNWWNGAACVWMGNAQMNGTADLFLYPYSVGMQFGLGIACGDFNGDGCDDIALSSPCFPDIPASFPGEVWVYAGNPQLHDTGTGTEDEVIPVIGSDWYFQAYPNPLHPNKELNLRFFGKGYENYPQLGLKIYNLRGQLIYETVLQTKELIQGEKNIGQLNLSAGIYVIRLYYEGKNLKSTKITIK